MGGMSLPHSAADAAIDCYRQHLARYRDTLDLLSPAGYAQLDRLVDEAEGYARLVAQLAPGDGIVLDVGSGAGLPGVVVAARVAPRPVWLVERRRRRATFLTTAVAAAGLAQVRVFNSDVRTLTPPPDGVVVVTAQAVASLVSIAEWTQHLWGARVVLVSRRGPAWPAEVEALLGWWRARTQQRHRSAWVGEKYPEPLPPQVLAREPLESRGTLIAVEVRGG